ADVIFAGSANRKPVGAASVTLTFENPVTDPDAADPRQRRFLGVDTEQVDVTRRLYRDGRSEYETNGRKCRLRDIKELFMDTGIGTNAYSIIEQGRVDAMLTANAQDRRSIFEEAAGVARFKARSVEAARKLERTEINLVRAREQLQQTERRLRLVRRQAAKARRFRELDARHRQLRIDLALDVYHEHRGRQDELARQLADLEASRQRLAKDLQRFEDEKQSAEIGRHRIENRQRELEQEKIEQLAARRHAEQRQALTERHLDEARQQLEPEQARINELSERSASLAAEVNTVEVDIADGAQRLADAEVRVTACGDEWARLQQQTVEAQERSEALREQVARIESERSQLAAQAESIDGRCRTLCEQRDRLAARAAQLADELAGCRRDHEAAGRRASRAAAEADRLSAQLSAHEQEASRLGEREASLGGALTELRHEHAAAESRRRLLKEMQEAHEGLNAAVKHILDDRPQFPGVRGLLADFIDTDRAQRADDAERVRKALRDVSGRVRLIAAEPIEAADAREGGNPAAQLPDWVTPLAARIQVSPPAGDAVRRLLGTTAIVPDLGAAMLLASGPLSGWRFVTRAAEVFEPDGRMTLGRANGGSASTAAGWLTRRAELAELHRACESYEQRINELAAKLDSLHAESAEARKRQAAVSEQLHVCRHDAVEAGHRLQRAAGDVHRVEREQAGVRGETEELCQALDGLGTQRCELARRTDELQASLAEHETSIERAQAELRRTSTASRAAQEGLTAARIDLGQAGEKVDALKRERRHLELALEETKRQHSLSTEQIGQRLAQIEHYKGRRREAQRRQIRGRHHRPPVSHRRDQPPRGRGQARKPGGTDARRAGAGPGRRLPGFPPDD
ncbi:MAG: coiled-coil domain-containing protein, partial [Planctomycetota bacterium]